MDVPADVRDMSEYVYRDSECACSTTYLLPVVRQLLAGIPPGSIVADAGCGNGSMLAQLSRPDWEMHGLEISESGLAQARTNFPHIHFHAADLGEEQCMLPMIGTCDIVISTEVIEHLFLPRIFAKNCHRLLKSGGMLILSTPYHGYLKNLALAVSGNFDRHFTALWDHGHVKFWSKHTLTLLLEEAGFDVRRFQGVGRVPYLWKSMVVLATKRELLRDADTRS